MKNFIKKNGFTLTELLVAIVIVAILTIASVMLYTSQVRKSRRTDAVNTLFSISLAEERYRSNNTSYGTLAQVWGGVTTSTGGYYSLSISNVSGTTYTVSAVGQGNQASDAENGVSCTTLTLTVNSGMITKSPAVCWPS